jgi:hypothetical protein
MRAGERAKVLRLDRPVPTKEDRSRWEGREGLVVRRLNVAWDPRYGELWELRFDTGETVVFASSELGVVRPDGRIESSDVDAMRESWGQAVRGPSLPFRRFGAGVGGAPAVLALLVFALAGVLLLWAGIASGSWLLSGAGIALVLVGVAAVAVLVT